MSTYWLRFKLLSDAAFSRGDGVAGVVDSEVQHDRYGLTYLSGRALKGLLGNECADILFALEQQGQVEAWREPARRLFGTSGSTDVENPTILRIGNAQLPAELRNAVRSASEEENENGLSRTQVLESLTTVRYQTAIDHETGAAGDATLRSTRLILRKTPFEARLQFVAEPTQKDKALLAACAKAFRRAGTSRNRGSGELRAALLNSQGQDITETWFAHFKEEVHR